MFLTACVVIFFCRFILFNNIKRQKKLTAKYCVSIMCKFPVILLNIRWIMPSLHNHGKTHLANFIVSNFASICMYIDNPVYIMDK